MKAAVNIAVDSRHGRTVLREGYAESPFRVANITEDRASSWLHLMLMSSSPGVLDGDDYSMRVTVGEGCCLRLHTQAFLRLFDMREGARQWTEVMVGKDASFVYLPHPVAPHRSSIFSCVNALHLSVGSRLIWGEVLTCGRKARGEVFSFTRYHSLTTVYRSGVMICRENMLLEPALRDCRGMGQMEGYSHQASLLMAGMEAGFDAEVRARMALAEDVAYGLSEGPGGIWVLRMLGHGAEPLYHFLQVITEMVSGHQTPFYAG